MENILTGTYININSPIHKLNVKYKMPCLILALAFTVISNNAVMYLIKFQICNQLCCTVTFNHNFQNKIEILFISC